jgi:lipopolysaccharide export LptBFGC system permease protein LptF
LLASRKEGGRGESLSSLLSRETLESSALPCTASLPNSSRGPPSGSGRRAAASVSALAATGGTREGRADRPPSFVVCLLLSLSLPLSLPFLCLVPPLLSSPLRSSPLRSAQTKPTRRPPEPDSTQLNATEARSEQKRTNRTEETRNGRRMTGPTERDGTGRDGTGRDGTGRDGSRASAALHSSLFSAACCSLLSLVALSFSQLLAFGGIG